MRKQSAEPDQGDGKAEAASLGVSSKVTLRFKASMWAGFALNTLALISLSVQSVISI